MSKNLLRVFLPLNFFIFLILMPVIILSPNVSAISQNDLVALTNTSRELAGRGKLQWSDKLAASALAKANHMCKNQYWAHEAPDGTTAWSFMESTGYEYKDAGENLAKGFSDDKALHDGWLNSVAHKKNILKAEYTEIGIGKTTCEFLGAQTTIVVAHYGSLLNNQSNQQIPSDNSVFNFKFLSLLALQLGNRVTSLI